MIENGHLVSATGSDKVAEESWAGRDEIVVEILKEWGPLIKITKKTFWTVLENKSQTDLFSKALLCTALHQTLLDYFMVSLWVAFRFNAVQHSNTTSLFKNISKYKLTKIESFAQFKSLCGTLMFLNFDFRKKKTSWKDCGKSWCFARVTCTFSNRPLSWCQHLGHVPCIQQQ